MNAVTSRGDNLPCPRSGISRGDNPGEALAQVGQIVLHAGPERSLGLARIVTADEVMASMPCGPWLNGPAGFPPAGVLGVLIDNVLGLAIVRERGTDPWTVSAEISLDLVRPVPADGARVRASARYAHSGPRGGFSSGTVCDAAGKLIATCRQHGRWVTTGTPGPVASREAASREAAKVTAGSPQAGWIPPASLDALLGARVQPTEGGAVLDLPVTADLVNPLGNLHGGITFAACDLAAQAALHAVGGPTQTASIHVAYPRPMPPGTTPRFEARLVHRGQTLAVVHVSATIDGGRPCSLATITTTRPFDD